MLVVDAFFVATLERQERVHSLPASDLCINCWSNASLNTPAHSAGWQYPGPVCLRPRRRFRCTPSRISRRVFQTATVAWLPQCLPPYSLHHLQDSFGHVSTWANSCRWVVLADRLSCFSWLKTISGYGLLSFSIPVFSFEG